MNPNLCLSVVILLAAGTINAQTRYDTDHVQDRLNRTLDAFDKDNPKPPMLGKRLTALFDEEIWISGSFKKDLPRCCNGPGSTGAINLPCTLVEPPGTPQEKPNGTCSKDDPRIFTQPDPLQLCAQKWGKQICGSQVFDDQYFVGDTDIVFDITPDEASRKKLKQLTTLDIDCLHIEAIAYGRESTGGNRERLFPPVYDNHQSFGPDRDTRPYSCGPNDTYCIYQGSPLFRGWRETGASGWSLQINGAPFWPSIGDLDENRTAAIANWDAILTADNIYVRGALVKDPSPIKHDPPVTACADAYHHGFELHPISEIWVNPAPPLVQQDFANQRFKPRTPKP